MNTMRSLVVTIALIATAVFTAQAQRSDCKETKTPKHLPAASALIDSAAALQALAVIDAPEGMLFSLIFRAGDSLPYVRPLFETDTAAATIVTRWMRSQKPDSMRGVRIRVAQGPPASLQLERAIYCPPILIPESRAPRTGMMVRVQPSDQPRVNAMGRATIEIEAKISEDGIPITVNLVEPSGVAELDEDIAHSWREARFQPALMDGVRVEAWYKPGGKSPRL